MYVCMYNFVYNAFSRFKFSTNVFNTLRSFSLAAVSKLLTVHDKNSRLNTIFTFVWFINNHALAAKWPYRVANLIARHVPHVLTYRALTSRFAESFTTAWRFRYFRLCLPSSLVEVLFPLIRSSLLLRSILHIFNKHAHTHTHQHFSDIEG